MFEKIIGASLFGTGNKCSCGIQCDKKESAGENVKVQKNKKK